MDVNHRPELVLLLGSHWMIWIAILQPSALVRRIVFIFYLFPWICGLLPCPLFVHRHSHIHALQWPAWQRWEGTRLRILSTSFLQICLQNTSEVFKQQMCIRGANITYLSLFILCKVVYLLSISIYIYIILHYTNLSHWIPIMWRTPTFHMTNACIYYIDMIHTQGSRVARAWMKRLPESWRVCRRSLWAMMRCLSFPTPSIQSATHETCQTIFHQNSFKVKAGRLPVPLKTSWCCPFCWVLPSCKTRIDEKNMH